MVTFFCIISLFNLLSFVFLVFQQDVFLFSCNNIGIGEKEILFLFFLIFILTGSKLALLVINKNYSEIYKNYNLVFAQ